MTTTLPDPLPPFLVPHPVHGHLEYVLPISAKTVIDYHGRIPLLRNERDEWELPGGKLDLGESPEDTARREAREELGLGLQDLHIAHAWVYEITPDRHVFVVAYATRYTGDEKPRYSREHKELGLFAPQEVSGLTMPAPYKTAITKALRLLR
ncbi:NUDIX hydrolase [Actinocrinis puniceicyclus]|uniref:NUDIX hydrolase n=1 Tax=Actinocrinis puniceicyclus TaxID=977794 RepID=A0A8J8BBE2_9ACTN|nr:NUDIX hydrolase [Actinocrinis puniceicyclus]MBS2963952.1 NUDIX hydrolase [Actinocrinis puniceicyclus]